MSPPAPYVPRRFIPDGEVVLGDPDTTESGRWVGRREPVPRGFDSWEEYVDVGCPFHPYYVHPGEEGPGIPERVYRRYGMGRTGGSRL